jgi:hypothetical protein
MPLCIKAARRMTLVFAPKIEGRTPRFDSLLPSDDSRGG